MTGRRTQRQGYGLHLLVPSSTEQSAHGRDVDGSPLSCPACGFVAGSLSWADLVAAVMRVPGEYQEALARFGSFETIDELLRVRAGRTGWSPLERVAHVADWFHRSARVAGAMLDGEPERCAPVHVDAPRAGSNSWPVQVALGSLITGASDLGRSVSSADAAAWHRAHPIAGTTMTVRDVVDNALHAARHHLREVVATLGDAPKPASRT